VRSRKRTTGHKPTPATGEIILYRTEDGDTRIECRFAEGTIWLTQALIAELFQTTVPNVNLHLKNIYDQAEISAEATIKDFLIVRQEGERKVSRTVFHSAKGHKRGLQGARGRRGLLIWAGREGSWWTNPSSRTSLLTCFAKNSNLLPMINQSMKSPTNRLENRKKSSG